MSLSCFMMFSLQAPRAVQCRPQQQGHDPAAILATHHQRYRPAPHYPQAFSKPDASSSANTRRSNAPQSVPVSSVSPAQLLHKVEFTAIAIAAVCQAAVLVTTALHQWHQAQQVAELQAQLDLSTAPEAAASTGTDHHQILQQQGEQQLRLQHEHRTTSHHPATTGLHLVTSSALVVGLLCGAGLRQLHTRQGLQQGSGGLRPSADAAARLAALEVSAQQTAAQLTDAARQMDKLQARVRLATSDLKQPIKATQGAAAQQAAALLKLSEQQALLQKQVEGNQELIAALQGLAAKQFKVSAEALQQLKNGQAQLSTSTSKALGTLQQQQQALQQQLQAQQQQLRTLQASSAAQQQQQSEAHQQPAGNGTEASHAGSSSSCIPPDPWQAAAGAPDRAGDGGSSGSGSNTGTANGQTQADSSRSSSSVLDGTGSGHVHNGSLTAPGLNGTHPRATSAN